MRWLNKYQKGFNRLWLVFSITVAVVFVAFNTLLGEYQVSDPSEGVRYIIAPVTAEEMIKHRATELWLKGIKHAKRGVTHGDGKALIEDLFDGKQPSTIYGYVKSMPEAKFFTFGELRELIAEAIEVEKKYQDWVKTYPQRKWKARGRFLRDLLGAFIVTFAIGQGVFLIVWWIIRGFR